MVARTVQSFLAKLEMRPCKPEQQGTTWLELYTLYKVKGNPCAIGDSDCKAEARPAVGKQILAFRNVVRAVASNTMGNNRESSSNRRDTRALHSGGWGLRCIYL